MKMRIRKPFIIAIAAALAVLAAAGIILGAVFLIRGKGNVTVTFVTNGGKEIAPVTLEKGEEYTLPEAEKEGVVFADWYYDGAFGSVCPRTITAKKDVTLYARYGAVLTFDTAGGTEIEQRTYFEGEELGTLPVSYKNGFSFSGWYYDAEHSEIVGKKDCINRSLTVYAEFSVASDTIRKITSVKHVSDSPVIEVLASGVILHNGNVDEYISLSSANGEKTGLNCRQDGNDFFVLEPNRKLDEGMTYSLKALSSAVKFVTVDGKATENADEVTVTTHKDEKEIVKEKPTVRITSENLAKWDEKVYVYNDSGLEKDVSRIVARTKKEIAVGTIVVVGETEKESPDDYICKVISVRKERMQYVVGAEIKEDDFVIMDVVTPNVDDVYDAVDVYGEKQAQLEGVIKISEETIAENVQKNEGIATLKNSVKNAVAQSPTITNYANGLSANEKSRFYAAIENFGFSYPKVKIDIKGTSLAFEIEVGGEIQFNKVKIGVAVTIANKTEVNYRYTICKSGLVTINPLVGFTPTLKWTFPTIFRFRSRRP